MSTPRLRVTVLSGFLGAGAALSRTDEKLVEMSNGCICCTLRGHLLLEVKRLAAEGRVDCLLIESTGIGEPMPVAATCDRTTEEGETLNDVSRIDTMVTVVDAHNLLAGYSSTDLLSQRGAHLRARTSMRAGKSPVATNSMRSSSSAGTWIVKRSHRPGRRCP